MKAEYDRHTHHLHLISETPQDVEDLERLDNLWGDYLCLKLEERVIVRRKPANIITERKLIYKLF